MSNEEQVSAPSEAINELKLFQDTRSTLCDSQGRRYDDVRAALLPNYLLVWAEMLAGHGALIALACAYIFVDFYAWPIWGRVAIAVCGGVAIGYTVAYLALWFHEASHFNIHPDRKINDTLANLFLGSLLGLHIRDYRKVHFGHHRFLGTTQDPERSYFNPLNMRYLLESLLGVRALKVLLLRKRIKSQPAENQGAGAGVSYMAWIGWFVNGAVLLPSILLAGAYEFAAAWVMGLLIFFPFFGALRQLLEHRRADAAPGTDFTRVHHGALSRNFGTGPIACTLGGAGFNRHLIHHWDMTLSCTRFREMEAFLKDSQLGDHYRMRETTYGRTLWELFV